MSKYCKNKYLERHQKMLEYQKKIFPFTPTVRELSVLWKIKSTSNVAYCLRMLDGMGLMLTRKMGRDTKYYAKVPEIIDDPKAEAPQE